MYQSVTFGFVSIEGRVNEHHVVWCCLSAAVTPLQLLFGCSVLAESCSASGFICSPPQRARERESRFRKLEACTLQVFELCHWRQHSHKVDGCPSPEVFPCQQACSALCRWIQTLSASQTEPFVWVFGKLFALPPTWPARKTPQLLRPLCGAAQEASFFFFKKSMIKQPALIKSHLIFTNKEKKTRKACFCLSFLWND